MRFERVDISFAGANGLQLGRGCRDVVVSNSRVSMVGAEGITVQGNDARDVLVNNTIVRDTALTILGQPAGIRLRGASNITVSHCDVSNNPYGGILAGWMPAGLPTPQPRGAAVVFTIAYNRVHDVGMGILSDFAAIYLSSGNNLCFQPQNNNTCSVPTLVHQNVVSRTSSYNYGGSGVYMDEQVASVRITSNVLHDLADTGIYFHCGTNNTASNNVIAFASQEHNAAGYFRSCNSGGNPTYPNISHGFTYERNLHYISSRDNSSAAEQQQQLTVDRDYRDTSFDWNVYFAASNASTAPLVFPNHTAFAQWQAQGQDEHASLADPRFANPGSGDFDLLPGSPALAMGFEPIDLLSPGVHAPANPFGIE